MKLNNYNRSRTDLVNYIHTIGLTEQEIDIVMQKHHECMKGLAEDVVGSAHAIRHEIIRMY